MTIKLTSLSYSETRYTTYDNCTQCTNLSLHNQGGTHVRVHMVFLEQDFMGEQLEDNGCKTDSNDGCGRVLKYF